MGTTAEKLNYLKETKSEIKNALETPSNIFRDYPSLIKKYIDNQPTSKVSNGVCTNALDVPIVRVGIDGNSYQGENPSPDNPQEIETINSIGLEQSGKNKFDLEELVKMSPEYSKIEDGYTFEFDMKMYLDGVELKDPILLPASISYTIRNVTGTNLRPKLWFDNNTTVSLKDYGSGSDKNEDYNIVINNIIKNGATKITKIGLDISMGGTFSLTKFMISETSTSLVYEPYHSPKVIPIDLQGNSIAKVGDVKDVLKINRNGEVKIEKNINELVLDSSYANTFQSYNRLLLKKIPNIMHNSKILSVNSNMFKGALKIDLLKNDNLIINDYEGNGSLILRSTQYTSLEEYKTMLDEKRPKIYYGIEQPQTIELPSIPPIELWQGTNIFKLITNLDTTFEVEYVVNKDYIMNTLETQNLLNIVEGENI